MAEKTTSWIVLFHRFDLEEKFLSSRIFNFRIKAGKESLVFCLLASYCQSEHRGAERELKDLKECLELKECSDKFNDEWNNLSLLLYDMRDFRTKVRLACFARVD